MSGRPASDGDRATGCSRGCARLEGRLTLDQAEAIADAALACGNGAISLSARGNLQIRGVREAALQDLQARLDEAGLIDADPDIERLRNIVASPLSDIDPEAAFDLAPRIAALEARLAEDAALRPLPAKFSFVIDAGGRLGVGDIDADIRFEAARELARRDFRDLCRRRRRARGDLQRSRISAPLHRRLRWRFSMQPTRLARGACARSSRSQAPRRSSPAQGCRRASVRARRGRRRSRDALGAHAYDGRVVVGAAAPFGDIDAERFKALLLRAKSLSADS